MTESTNYKRSFSGSMGAGMKSVFGGSGRRFYELEFRTSSEKHRAGETQKVIVDQIEIGRDSQCGIRFGEDCKTVSRRHAAIVKDGNGWKLVQLSKTNSTYLNGRKVENEWYLQNGDEIQLSSGGPRIGFMVREGAGSLVKSINLTNRLSLFRQQALRPYKRAITALSILLGVAIVGGALSTILLNKENRELRADAGRQKEMIDSMKKEQDNMATDMKAKDKIIAALQSDVKRLKRRPGPVPSSDSALNGLDRYVYYVEIAGYRITTGDGEVMEWNAGDEIKIEDIGTVQGGSGTGFMLSDGRFVTAHHVVEPWDYWGCGGINKFLYLLNVLNYNGAKVEAHIKAISPMGDRLDFYSSAATCDRNTGYKEKQTDEGYRIRHAPLGDGGDTDYAYYRRGGSNGLTYNAELSRNLKRGTQLVVLGFPLGEGVRNGKIQPLLSHTTVSQDGLYGGIILTTNRNFEHGNSGGPVYYMDENGKYSVVGIISGGLGETLGYIVPISAIR